MCSDEYQTYIDGGRGFYNGGCGGPILAADSSTAPALPSGTDMATSTTKESTNAAEFEQHSIPTLPSLLTPSFANGQEMA